MDNMTAKEILSAYRSNGADARDETFREALEQCRHDPAMREWLEKEQRFDAEVSAALAAAPAPREGKERLLRFSPPDIARPQVEKTAKPRSVWTRWTWGIAALLVVGLMLWQAFPRGGAPLEPATFTIAGLVKEAMPLSYRSNDPADIKTWLAARGAPLPDSLPPGLAEASALGCRVLKVAGGGEISLLCLSRNGEVVHFFVFNREAGALVEYAPLNTWWEEEGWNIYSYMENDRRIVLATQGIMDMI